MAQGLRVCVSNQTVGGSHEACSACFDKSLICLSQTCSHQCHRLVHQRPFHVLACVCDKACKRSLAICRESRVLCPVSRLPSVPIWPACAEQGRYYNPNPNPQSTIHHETCSFIKETCFIYIISHTSLSKTSPFE